GGSAGLLRISGTPFLINSRPINRIPKPTMVSAMLRQRWFLENRKAKNIPISAMAMGVICILKPNSATIQAVMVVPMLAPMITPVDCTKLSRPALTKLTAITVVVVDDWVIAVV